MLWESIPLMCKVRRRRLNKNDELSEENNEMVKAIFLATVIEQTELLRSCSEVIEMHLGDNKGLFRLRRVFTTVTAVGFWPVQELSVNKWLGVT